jgi:hypothetical protein
MKVSGLASWFGSNRILASEVGVEIGDCSWCGIVFAGSMSEAKHIKARCLYINDKHTHIINLAQVVASPTLGPKLYRALRRIPFHPESLAIAQERCKMREEKAGGFAWDTPVEQTDLSDPLQWAIDYFVCAWMPRHGTAGTKSEFDTGLSVRWSAGGGDSAVHYRGMIQSLSAWRKILRRGNFTTLDFREFLGKCKDETDTGIYSDSPFPGPGDAYKHPFTPKDHRDLAKQLRGFTRARVVCRFYDHPLVRELYPESHWTWRILEGGRTQTNDSAPEILLLNGPSFAKEQP